MWQDIGSAMANIRDHAVVLARQQIQNEIHALSALEADPDDKASVKDSILRKLKRLSPGEATGINAMSDAAVSIHTDPEEIAAILKQHWEGVFTHKEVNDLSLQIWMEELFVKDSRGCFLTGLPAGSERIWRITRPAIKRAIDSSRDSMPGPDCIPAKAYKILGGFAGEVLYDAAMALGTGSHGDLFREAYADRCPEGVHDFNLSLLCCLPKKPHGIDPEHGEFYAGEDTRPLAIVNTDNRIIASAARLVWEPILATYISNMQQGFIKHRQMMNNLIDVDFHAMTVSLTMPNGALLFFDFKAAFPSVAHRFLMNSLRAIGLPEHALSLIRSLYDSNKCDISYKGSIYEGFGMFCGVRQGCPLSPLLFAASVDVLLRMLQKRLPLGTFRAFADDIGAVLTDWQSEGPLAETTFSEFAGMSGLDLNIKKTLCIPLWEDGVKDITRTLRESNRDWQDLCVTDHGTYLGFVQGPARCNKSWEKPLRKYRDRCYSWGGVGAGLQFSTVAYNTFAFSTLSYISQLEVPPVEAAAAEQRGLRAMLPGPNAGPNEHWCTGRDATYLKELYGQAKSFHSLSVVSRASMLRVLHTLNSTRKASRSRTASIHDMHNVLSRLRAQTDYIHRGHNWRGWYDKAYVSTLVQNERQLAEAGISTETVLADIAGTPRPWDEKTRARQKAVFQKQVSRAIKLAEQPNGIYRIRHKLSRWFDKDRNRRDSTSIGFKLAGTPQHIATRCFRNLQMLPSLVPPRICAAVLRTIFNGWCTARRFQKRRTTLNRCLLGCGADAEDSIEHYCCCPAVQDTLWCKLRLRFHGGRALSYWMMNEESDVHHDHLRGVAIIVYAAYMATNTYRKRGRASYQTARDAVGQFIIQGVSGHAGASEFVDNRWNAAGSHIV